MYIRDTQVDGVGPWTVFDISPGEGTWDIIVQGWHEIRSNLHLVTDNFDTVVQAGGHQGLYPRCLSSIFQEVYTFEPHLDNFACLTANCNLPNIHKFNSALGKQTGTIWLEEVGTSGQHRIWDESINRPVYPIQVKQRIPVPVTTIDRQQLTHCSLILLDVEGHELEVLMGAAQTIEKFHPGIIVERSFFDSTTDEVDSWLTSHGYTFVHRTEMDRYYSYNINSSS